MSGNLTLPIGRKRKNAKLRAKVANFNTEDTEGTETNRLILCASVIFSVYCGDLVLSINLRPAFTSKIPSLSQPVAQS